MRTPIFQDKRIILSFIFGIIVTALGILGVVSSLGFVLPIPTFVTSIIVLKVVLALAGIMLLYDSFKMGYGFNMILYVLAGVLLFVLGVLPFLVDFHLLGFLPFAVDLAVSPLVLGSALIAYGLYLVVNAFKIVKIYRMLQFYPPYGKV